jgi:hypothetical protein
MMRFILPLLGLLALASCGAEPKWADEEEIRAVSYRKPGATTLTLFTVINNRSDNGGHSGLMINGSQRVLFDPAGSWYHPQLPERNDVHYGITDPVVDFYIDYHARITWRVVRQDIEVSPEVAELALKLVQENGAVAKAMCASTVSDILNDLPGFESIPNALFPEKIMKAFAKLPGVTEEVIYDDDPEENGYILVSPI